MGKEEFSLRQTGWRLESGEERTEKSVVFVNFVKLGKLGPSSPSLTEFVNFRVFYPISYGIYELTRKIVRFYESTREFDNHTPQSGNDHGLYEFFLQKNQINLCRTHTY